MELFNIGSRAHHTNAGVDVVIERDDGGETVHVGYKGGRSQRVPRGVLVAIAPPEAKESTTGKIKKVSKPQSKDRAELTQFMREIQTLADIASLDKRHDLGINYSSVASFGMYKMQAMTKLWSKVSKGTVTMADVWARYHEEI